MQQVRAPAHPPNILLQNTRQQDALPVRPRECVINASEHISPFLRRIVRHRCLGKRLSWTRLRCLVRGQYSLSLDPSVDVRVKSQRADDKSEEQLAIPYKSCSLTGTRLHLYQLAPLRYPYRLLRGILRQVLVCGAPEWSRPL
jgi:hypothetical protein